MSGLKMLFPTIVLTVVLTTCTVLILWLGIKVYHYVFMKTKQQCWFCHSLVVLKRSEKKQFTCPSCGQYNGFSVDGNYDKEIPEMYDESLNPPAFPQNNESKRGSGNSYNDLCYSCNRNQELKLYQLSSFAPMNPKNYDGELEEFRTRLESTYRLCLFCDRVVKDKLSLQDKWLRDNFPSLNRTKTPEVKQSKPVKRSLRFILLAPRLTNLLFISSGVVGALLASVDVPCFVQSQVLDDLAIQATLEAVRENMLYLTFLGFSFMLGSFGFLSWKHQLYKIDFLLLLLWVTTVILQLHNRPEYRYGCVYENYIQSGFGLLLAVVSIYSSSCNRRIVLKKELTNTRSYNADKNIDKTQDNQSLGRNPANSSLIRHSASDGFDSSFSQKDSPSSTISISPSESASQIGTRPVTNVPKDCKGYPKPVKLFDNLDNCSIDTGISCLKIGSPTKRSQYFVPKPANSFLGNQSVVSRSIFSSKPVVMPPKFKPPTKANFWFSSNEFQDFKDFHKYNASQSVSRSSSQSSGFESQSDFNERTLIPEYTPPSPSSSRRSSISDLTEVFRGYSKTSARSRLGCDNSRALMLAENRDLGRTSRISSVSQIEMKDTWSWLPFILGFSLAINVCVCAYVVFLK
ncbi:transmembrane protein 201 homolog [Artemia franciscana]|uniref:transmembrane protein 201 homolog n=1 Tax=Artemia franciscana TaxID=6661 RepID=UPI0032D9FB8A